MTTKPMWPLYFRNRCSIRGPSFAATVQIIGRVTWTLDFGKTWLYGVNPGGLAASGRDLDDALRGFTEHLTGVLQDYADEGGDVDSFRHTVEQFVGATDDESVAEWEAGRALVRSGSEPDVELPREPWDLEPMVAVHPVGLESLISSAPSIHEDASPDERPTRIAA